MNIALGATRLNLALNSECGHDGIAVYTQGLMSTLPLSIITPAIFASDPNEYLAGNVHALGGFASFSVRSFLRGSLFNPFCSDNQPDLFHATDHFIPRLPKTPVLANIHDAVSLMRPDWVSGGWERPAKNLIVKRMLNWADHYLADSSAVVSDLASYVGIDENKISVVPLGVDSKYYQQIPLEKRADFFTNLGLPRSFFLFVGTLQPRKNIGRILAAHACLDSALRREMPLVFVGKIGWKFEKELIELRRAIDKRQAYWFQNVDDMGKQILLQSALALVFPSLYEGFGLPILEAFASGLPVITSNVSAMPEVAGDAALLVNPLDVEDIAFAMQRIAESPTLAFELSEKGRVRSREFTWQKTAEQTMAVYREMM
ncbi:glycosyltransferase family 4 protein [Chitinibacter bivalviorum]|uniref:Glycosyltransferase family 4 protein n=1 Tax=Chitinibacter bivalviorum TaxID=2739434 RepID=A0A7H9BMJ7_9NEIS|nr:glycosyltransferase family 1 protein [Chitinibacter bivalviorum]QLG89662.1 glycosyltransferase family 4 protein [Chitinibacter bivalviorum]